MLVLPVYRGSRLLWQSADRMRGALRKAGKLLRLLGMRGAPTALLRHGVAATTEHGAFLGSRPFRTILDVGANRGQFSLAARHFNSSARIIAFEPLPAAAAVYRAVFSADQAVTLHVTAIGPTRGQASMQVSGREDSSSLLPISEKLTELYPGTDKGGDAEVPICPLPDLVPAETLVAPALLKIDVQGFELEVLKSALPLLPRLSAVYVEASFVNFYTGQALASEVIDYLHANGLRLTGFYNPSYDHRSGVIVQSDLLFEPA